MSYTLAKKMKNLILLLLAISINTTSVQADDGLLPPKDLRAEWKELHDKKFPDWTIKTFHGWGNVADGGSNVFSFESHEGERFELVVANPAYWNAEDKKEGHQVYFVIHKNRFYRLEPKSEEEKNIIEKLSDAAERLSGKGTKDPKLLLRLASRLESRESAFKTKG